jgi:hypothetical protein
VASILQQIGTKVGEELKALTPADSYAETTFNTDGILVSSTTWSSPAKTSKIGSKVLTYTNGSLTRIVEKDGSDVITLTKTITYDGDGNVSSTTKDYA